MCYSRSPRRYKLQSYFISFSEQIRRAQENMDKIHHNLNYSDRLVRGIGSIWGSVTNYFTSAPSTATTTTTTPAPQTKQPSPKPTFARAPTTTTTNTKVSPSGGLSEDFLKYMSQDDKGNYLYFIGLMVLKKDTCKPKMI